MNPSFSVILFTTLSGAGYGLLAWLGIHFAWRSLPLHREAAMIPLVVGLVLVTIGLSSSVFHLGKPLRAWRAFSQWRTAWLSREGVLALIAYVPALLLAWLVWCNEYGLSMRFVGIALTLSSLATVACTAMIYASLKPIPGWRHPLVVPVYLVFALSTGLTLLAALMALDWSDVPDEYGHYIVVNFPTAFVIGVSALVLAGMKLVYWRGIDRIVLPSREAATALEGMGKVTVFERPHTEANYLTREMGFVLARKHSHKLRIIALLLFAVVPLIALLVAALLPSLTVTALWIAALAALAGAFVERWLFFAEAKHMVMLYY